MRDLRVVTQIFINQVPSDVFPARNGEISMDFVHEIETEDSWQDFTNGGKIIIPKNIFYRDANGKKVWLGNTNANVGGFSSNPPVFLRGDEVTIIAGYQYTQGSQQVLNTAVWFTGYISEVNSKMPITIEIEDNMWKLKQLPTPNKVFPASQYSLQSMLQELLQGSGFTVNVLDETNIGDFRTQGESVMEVLSILRHTYHMESYFRGNELRCGSLVYIESEAVNHAFVFQENIIEDKLIYRRQDDVVMSAIAYSINKIKYSGITKDGNTKSGTQRLEVYVSFSNGKFTSITTPLGQKPNYPKNFGGERRTLWYNEITDPKQLITLAENKLLQYYYTGFYGHFTTFGIPFVKMGDNASIYDNILPERNGQYKVKAVKYKLSVEGGLRQEVELDYRIGPAPALKNYKLIGV